MSVEDTGDYTPSFMALTTARDFIVWPPGWRPPSTTETVTLGTALTVSANGATVAGYMTSAGERWRARSADATSYRVGFIPPSAAGSYSAGATVPIYRLPRFPGPIGRQRGLTRPAIFQQYVDPPAQWNGFVHLIASYSRTAGVASFVLSTTASSYLRVGDQFIVHSLVDDSFNGTFTVASLVGATVTCINGGPDQASTPTTLAHLGRLLIDRADWIQRIRQWRRSFRNAWVRGEGPAETTGALVEPDTPISSIDWSRKGVQLRLIHYAAEPYRHPQSYTYFSKIYRVWAPVSSLSESINPADSCVDFAVDADIPTLGTMRVIWVAGAPQASFPSVPGTPPISGCTRFGRPRGHMDNLLALNGNQVVCVRCKELTNHYPVYGLGMPFMSIFINYMSIRPSMVGTLRFRAPGLEVDPAATAISVSGQWYRRRADNVDAAVGGSFSIAFTTPAAFGIRIYADDTMAAPIDAGYGDRPGAYWLRVTYAYTSSGFPQTVIQDFDYTRTSSNTQGTQNLKPDAFWPLLVPWPFDVMQRRFAADESDVRYVGNPGWILQALTFPTASVTPPTITRAGTTVTSSPGTFSTSDAAEVKQSGTSRVGLVKAINRAAGVSTRVGFTTVGGGAPIAIPLPALGAATADIEGTEQISAAVSWTIGLGNSGLTLTGRAVTTLGP